MRRDHQTALAEFDLVGDDELYSAQQDTLDLMRLVGADGWPKRSLYSQSVQDLVASFGKSSGYDEHDLNLIKPAIKELLHEEVASYKSDWRRIFPPTAVGGPKAEEDLLYQGPGYATDLDEATIDFLRFREKVAAVRGVLDVKAINKTAEELAS